jgi:tetratricopeptide (TPR) repeat protein
LRLNRESRRVKLRWLALAALAAAPVVRAEPYVPARDDEVLEQVAVRGELRAERARLAANPQDLALAVRLAQHYVRLGRQEADPRQYGRAQAVLAPWWNAPQPPAAVLRLRAQVRQSRHDFDGALADLDALLAQAPRDAEAWFMRAVIFEVQGEPERALASCAPLRRLADALSATACAASAASLAGRAAPSYALLASALERAPGAGAETRAWALTTLAEIAERTGRGAAAEEHYRAALAAAPPDHYRLAAFADFLLARGRHVEARALLEGYERMDALLLRAAIAARRLGAGDAGRLIDALGERFAAQSARNERVHLSSEARYALELRDDPARALELAQANFAVQREPIDLRILLEAALAAGRPGAARAALEWYERSGLEDTRIAALAERLE